MRTSEKLNQKRVDSILRAPTAGRRMVADGRGLALAVYQDSQGQTRGSYVLQVRTPAGRALRIGLGSAALVTLVEARKAAEEARGVVKAGGNPAEQRRGAKVAAQAAEASTLGAFIRNTYGPHMRDMNRKAADDSEARILAAWKPLLETPLTQITEQAICNVLRERKAAGKSPATVRRDWATFRPALVYARAQKMIPHLPLEGTPAPLEGMREEAPKRYLGKYDTDEPRRFLTALEAFTSAELGGGEFLRVACRLALDAGLRRGEVVKLTDSMISGQPGAELLNLPGAICKGNRARSIPLTPLAVEAIQRWQAVRKDLKLQAIDGALFPGDAEPWGRRITARELPRLLREAGISRSGPKADRVLFKSLRTTFGSLHAQAGVPLQQIQQWMGHSSVLTTEAHYGFLKPTTGAATARAFKVI